MEISERQRRSIRESARFRCHPAPGEPRLVPVDGRVRWHAARSRLGREGPRANGLHPPLGAQDGRPLPARAPPSKLIPLAHHFVPSPDFLRCPRSGPHGAQAREAANQPAHPDTPLSPPGTNCGLLPLAPAARELPQTPHPPSDPPVPGFLPPAVASSFPTALLVRGRRIDRPASVLEHHPDQSTMSPGAPRRPYKAATRGATVGTSVGTTVRLIYWTPAGGTDRRCMKPGGHQGLDGTLLAPPGPAQISVPSVPCPSLSARSKNSQSQRALERFNYRSSQSLGRHAPRSFGWDLPLSLPWVGVLRCDASWLLRNTCPFREPDMVSVRGHQVVPPRPMGSPFTSSNPGLASLPGGSIRAGRSSWGSRTDQGSAQGPH